MRSYQYYRHQIGYFVFFFFNDPPTTEIYTLSLHDALPIFVMHQRFAPAAAVVCIQGEVAIVGRYRRADLFSLRDRKSTRLNSSHLGISYAVFCLKKKKKKRRTARQRSQRSGYSWRLLRHTY